MSAEPPPSAPAEDRGTQAIETLREIRDEHRARGDLLAYRLLDRAMVRVARRLAGRTDAGRRDDEQPQEPMR